MVISPHPLATRAGEEVLAKGGSAIEAAIAVNAMMAVVYPHFCGIGGDAVWLVSDGRGNETAFMGIGQAIRNGDATGPIPIRGPRSALTTAAVVDSWAHALAHWPAWHSLGDLIAPAIETAAKGFGVSSSQAYWRSLRAGETVNWSGFDALFGPGEISIQPQLARTLEAIATDGARSFYEGALADRIVAGLNTAGVPIAHADLAETRTRSVAPIGIDYRGLRLLAPPAPTQGMTTLGIMGILSHFDFSSIIEDSAEHVHLVVEAVKRAFLDRPKIADPDGQTLDLDSLLDPVRLRAKADSIGGSAMEWPHRFAPADTVYFAAVDGEGRCASVLQSIYFDWGSGVVAGDTGILWQNRGAAFDPDPDHVNGFRPGKRPFYTLNPGMALCDGKPYLLYGTQGADGQPQTLAMLLTRLIDYGRSSAEALAGGRFLLGRTFSDSRDTLKLEGQFSKAVFEQLSRRGHEVSPIPAFSPLAGQAGVVSMFENGGLSGAHDPRG
ncbi:gamma-glutamyltransferase family protein [Pelagibacterium halotolerans]|nr:gamma-glutamyltransferase [Pelagibacterium halotolerans]QJR20506.1 gamma-glutamyltransferase [Pelagibacterium halotolerans]